MLGPGRGHKSDLLPDQKEKKREMSAMYRGRIERLRLSEQSIELSTTTNLTSLHVQKIILVNEMIPKHLEAGGPFLF